MVKQQQNTLSTFLLSTQPSKQSKAGLLLLHKNSVLFLTLAIHEDASLWNFFYLFSCPFLVCLDLTLASVLEEQLGQGFLLASYALVLCLVTSKVSP